MACIKSGIFKTPVRMSNSPIEIILWRFIGIEGKRRGVS